MHLESISNGLGAPSLLLLIMAIRKEIPATVSISADTGWENDRIWNTGRRSTNEQYFKEVIVPLCAGSHVTPRFVRSVDENKLTLDGLRERVIAEALRGRASDIPLFGSNGGRMRQTCTDKMKIRAIHQEERRMGAKTARNAQGIHFYEADRRTKGRFLYMVGQWSIYQTTVDVKVKDPITGEKRKAQKDIKWQTHYYPLVDLKMSRAEIYKAVEKEGVPYLVSSECDLCPHQDLARWERKSPETIDDGAYIESLFKGQFFFTPLRIPLKEAIAKMQADRLSKAGKIEADLDFGCGNSICGV
jgi:hypothetical protein